MTHKEIAERLRKMAGSPACSQFADITHLADEIDPPKPAPGTLVWWRHNDVQKWEIGEAGDRGVWVTGSENIVLWENIEYKPAHILAPDQVAVKLSPVTVWREGSEWVTFGPNIKELQNAVQNTVYHIHGAKPERMQRDD